MSSPEALMRERLQRQIKQIKAKVQQPAYNFDLSRSFYDEIQSMKQSSSQREQQYKHLQNEQLQQNLRVQRQKLHSYQMQIDRLRIRMLQISRQQSSIRESINQKRHYYTQLKNKLQKQQRFQTQKTEQAFQLKKEHLLKQVQQLIQQKSKFINETQKLKEDLKKADNRNKKLQENNAKEIKAKKQAFLSTERQKSAKYQSMRMQQLKEQAIKDTEPKLLAIIKSSTEDRKKAEEQGKKALEEFKIQYKHKLQRDLTQAKQKIFAQTEQQKQEERNYLDKKYRQKYEQKHKQNQQQLARIKQFYGEKMAMQGRKMSVDFQEYMLRQKDSHNSQIDQIKRLKISYEEKITNLNENIKEVKQNKLRQYDQKYKREQLHRLQEIELMNQQKYRKAEETLKKSVDDKINNIKKEIGKGKISFSEDINAKYQRILLQEKRKLDEGIEKEKKAVEEYELKIIDIQKRRSKEEAKIQQMKRQRNDLLTKNEASEKKIAQYQAELQAYERYKFEKEKQLKKKSNEYANKKQNQFQQLKKRYLSKEDERVNLLKGLLQDFQEQNNESHRSLHEYRQQIEAKIKTKADQLKRLIEENSKMQHQNDILQREIDEQSKKITT